MLLPTTYITTFTDANGQVSSSAITTSESQPIIFTQTDSGLARNDKIALGVGLGIGIPSLLIAIFGIYWSSKHHSGGQPRGISNGPVNAPINRPVIFDGMNNFHQNLNNPVVQPAYQHLPV